MPLLVPAVCVKTHQMDSAREMCWQLHTLQSACVHNHSGGCKANAHIHVLACAHIPCVHVRARVYVLVSICAVFCALEDGHVACMGVRFRVLCVRAGRTY